MSSAAHHIETVLGLLLAVTVIVSLARRVSVPYPIALFLGGAALGFVPKLPRVELDPDLVFLLFLPPLLYAEAWWTSWRDFKANLRPISLLACGLVLTTTTAVAAVAHALIPGMGWGPAFVLGGVLAPTDTIAAAAVLHRLRVPRRILIILSGESLVNDATALVAYRAAVAAVATGVFSVGHAGAAFVGAVAGGVAVGLVVGYVATWVHCKQENFATSITLTLLFPFAAYLPAEAMHSSGVVAVVTAGIYAGRRGPRIFSAEVRTRAVAFWDVLAFILNGLLFVLVGLQLPEVIRASSGYPAAALLGYGAAVSGTIIGVRIVWVFIATYLPRWLVPAIRRCDPYPDWREVSVVAWTGLRGGVSLAAALAIPTVTAAGQPFPQRDLIFFLTFCALLATLVGQGAGLAPLIRWLGIPADGEAEREEARARVFAARAVIDALEEVAARHNAPPELIERVRGRYEFESHHFNLDGDGETPEELKNIHTYHHLRKDLIRLQRHAVIARRDLGEISDEAMHAVERDLDLEELRLGPKPQAR